MPESIKPTARTIRSRLVVLLLLLPALCWGQASAPGAAAIASAHPLATEAGHDILQQGGNAFDAAVAVAAVLAVVEPYSSGIGGGGFWLLHRAEDGHEVMLDGRERAPLAATEDLYLNDRGEVIRGLSLTGPLSAGIPGQPAALAHLAERYGKLPLASSLAAAIGYARNGFVIDEHYRRMATWRLTALQSDPTTSRQFLSNDRVPPVGYILRQPDLALTLEALAEGGRDGFYQGAVARQLVEGVQEAGGIWSLEDLAQYQVVEREPVRGKYRGMQIISAAPPSSGGVVLISMLNQLSQFDLATLDPVQRTHLLIEVMRRAYRDRADYLGDPDFVQMPMAQLLSPDYAAGLARSIQLDAATPSRQVSAPDEEGRDTTHYSIIDREGNRVSATLSINYPFGACFVPPGTGVLLNDEMDDFSSSPGVPNAYGLVGRSANAIAPGKRMLSSMTPTFVETERGVAVLGTPGGSRIISMLLLGILELEQGRGPHAWVSAPRIHHQYLPDQVQFEPGALSAHEQAELGALGHRLKPAGRRYGNMQGVYWDRQENSLSAASDPRGIGAATVR